MIGTARIGRSVAALLAATAVGLAAADGIASSAEHEIRVWTIRYAAHNGEKRFAYVVLPAWYGPENHPPMPMVVSPHGRNANGRSNAEYFENLPAVGGFAVISPDGMGRRLKLKSYAYAGQINDLARMPEFAEQALPWLEIDRRRVYALGSSMGGQETLMLVARHPQLLAGAAAMDSVTDLARRYDQLPGVPCDDGCLERRGQPYGLVLQSAMRREVGGTPRENLGKYAMRSASANAERIASSGVRLQIWWSWTDKVVTDQTHQSAALFHALRRLNRCAPVSAYAGSWRHSSEMRATALLPIALAQFGLLPSGWKTLPKTIRHEAAPACASTEGGG
jgi:pimeloyl-ACP methyl ester carboxylesterase